MPAFDPGAGRPGLAIQSGGDRPVGDIMTPRIAVEWIDANDPPEVQLQSLRQSRYSHVLLARGTADEMLGLVSKDELLHRVLDGKPPRIEAALSQPAIVHESARIFRILDMFKKAPTHVRLRRSSAVAVCGERMRRVASLRTERM